MDASSLLKQKVVSSRVMTAQLRTNAAVHHWLFNKLTNSIRALPCITAGVSNRIVVINPNSSCCSHSDNWSSQRSSPLFSSINILIQERTMLFFHSNISKVHKLTINCSKQKLLILKGGIICRPVKKYNYYNVFI